MDLLEINKDRLYIDSSGTIIYLPCLCDKHEKKFLEDGFEKNFENYTISVKFSKLYFDE